MFSKLNETKKCPHYCNVYVDDARTYLKFHASHAMHKKQILLKQSSFIN